MISLVPSVEQSSPTIISIGKPHSCLNTLSKHSSMYRSWLYVTTQTETNGVSFTTFIDSDQLTTLIIFIRKEEDAKIATKPAIRPSIIIRIAWSKRESAKNNMRSAMDTTINTGM